MSHARDLSFGELKRLCALTDGNLNCHLLLLEKAKWVGVTKDTDPSRPQTFANISTLGRKRYVEYLAVLEQVLSDANAELNAESLGVQKG